MENRLISMTEKVLELEKEFNNGIYTFAEFTNIVCNYANFLNKPLKLEYFVPCDDEGNILEEPKFIPEEVEFEKLLEQYENAREKVLFDGFGVCDRNSKKDCIILNQEDHINIKWLENKTIEDLVKYNLTLTLNAIKQFNL